MKGFIKSKLIFSLITVVLLASAIVIPLSGHIIPSHAAPASSQSSWNIVPSPNGGVSNVLASITVVSTNDVWAVGTYTLSSGVVQTLTEHWNGNAWNVVPSSNQGSGNNFLTGV